MKICILHRYPKSQINQTNAAFPYLLAGNVEVKTFKTFNRLNDKAKLLKSILWIFYSPFLVLRKGYDVIFCDDSFPFYPILVKLASPRSKVILRLGDLHLMYYCSGKLYKILHEIEKIGWRLSDKILAISEPMADLIRAEVDTPVKVIYDPIDPEDFPLVKKHNDKKRVMFHGLLTKNKGVDMIMQAAWLMPEIEFWIVGDGPDKKRLEALAPKNVYFTGWVSFNLMYLHIGNCDIGIAMRSNNPGNEYVVTSPFLQYGIMGKPCIVTKRKVFKHYPWVFTTPLELKEKIEILLELPSEGEWLRKFVLKNHDAKTIASEILECLK